MNEELHFLVKAAQLSKNATQFWENVKGFFGKNWAPITAVAAGITLPAIGRYYLNKSIHASIADPDFAVPSSDKIIQNVKAEAGLNKIPHKTFKTLNNAFYVPPGAIPEERAGFWKQVAREKRLSKDKIEKETGSLIDTMLEYSINPKGGIIVGEKFTNPYVVAHEIGHAKISHEGGIYGFMQKYGPLAQAAGAVSMFGGILPTVLGYKKLGKGMFFGGAAATGLGLGAELLYEREASRIAEELLKKQEIKARSRELGKGLLDKSWNTYLLKSLATALPLGGGYLAGGIRL